MSHMEVDSYARTSWLYKFDPRVKLACVIAFVVVVAVMRTLEAVVAATVFVLVLAALSRVPAKHLAYHFALSVPFIAFAAVSMLFTKGWENSLVLSLRITACVLAVLILVTTTPFFKTLQALRYFRVPKLIGNLLLFTYRFIFLLIDEMARMSLARKARGFTGGRSLRDRYAFKTISATIGMTFVRSNVRAGAIYDALLSRGFTGEVKTLTKPKAGARDVGMIAIFILAAIMVISLELGVWDWKLLA